MLLTARGEVSERVEGLMLGADDYLAKPFAMDELVARVRKTIEYIDTVSSAALEGSETREVVIKLRDRTLQFPGLEFLQVWALPNFFFHHVTAYNLLRHNGVDIGKRDFLGG
jgi:hypothetical protein